MSPWFKPQHCKSKETKKVKYYTVLFTTQELYKVGPPYKWRFCILILPSQANQNALFRNQEKCLCYLFQILKVICPYFGHGKREKSQESLWNWAPIWPPFCHMDTERLLAWLCSILWLCQTYCLTYTFHIHISHTGLMHTEHTLLWSTKQILRPRRI